MTWRYSLQSGGILLAALSLIVSSLADPQVSMCSREDTVAYISDEPCDYWLKSDYGIIQSDNFPNPYRAIYKCTWHLSIPRAGLFTFKPVVLEFPINQTSGKCNEHSTMNLRLKYENPERSGYDDVETNFSCEDFVDANGPKEVTVPVRESTLMTFDVSTSWKNDSGRFSFVYYLRQASRKADTHPCGPKRQIFHDGTWSQYGYLTSPGYPVLYPSNVECEWVFFQFENLYFVLTLDIQGESRKNKTCRGQKTDDTITVVDNTNSVLASWCGSDYTGSEHHFTWTNKSKDINPYITVRWKPAEQQNSPFRTVIGERILAYRKGFKITWVTSTRPIQPNRLLISTAWRLNAFYTKEVYDKYILLLPPDTLFATFLFNVSVFNTTITSIPVMCGAHYIDIWSYSERSAERVFNCDNYAKVGDTIITLTQRIAAVKDSPIMLRISRASDKAGPFSDATVRFKYDLIAGRYDEEYCYWVTKCKKEGGCIYIGHVTSDRSSFPTEDCLLHKDRHYDDDYDQDRYQGIRYIQLVVEEMDIPESPECMHNYLYFGGVRFCGYHPFPFTKFLTTNGTRSVPTQLRFYTKNRYQRNHYKIWFKIEDKKSSAWTGTPPEGKYGCPKMVQLPSGENSYQITSPNYPGPYRDPARKAPRNYLCEWNIKTKETGMIYVHVKHVDLVNSDDTTSGYYRPDTRSPFVKEEGVRDSRVSSLCLVDAILLGNESIPSHDYKEAVVCEYFQDRIGLWYSFPIPYYGTTFPIRFLVREAKGEWMTNNKVEPDTPPMTEHTISFVKGFNLHVYYVPDCRSWVMDMDDKADHENPSYLQSHNWPNTGYFPNQQCSWTVMWTKPDSRGYITVMFRDLDLDNTPGSCDDSVTIVWRNARKDSDSQIYCSVADALEKQMLVPAVNGDATITIMFVTDAVKNQGRGFSLVMYFENSYYYDQGPSCGGPLPLKDGIKSPSYPYKYYGYMSGIDEVAPPTCIWSWYLVEQYGQLRVIINELFIPKEGGKCGSHLAFTFNNSFSVEKQESEESVILCGSRRNFDIVRQIKRGADVYVKFVRTLHRAEGKFKISFQWTPTESAYDSGYCARASQGTVVKEITPFSIDTWNISYPPPAANGSAQTCYEGSRRCEWDIVTTEHHVKATIRLRYLDVEPSSMCMCDYVDILKERFCGSNEEWEKREDKDKEIVVMVPPNARTTVVIFDADNLVQGHGFKLDMELEAVHSTGASFLPNNCKKLQAKFPTSGVRMLVIQQLLHIKVYCDQQSHGGGWTVIQRRKDGSVNFRRNWKEYAEGFGDLDGNFWMGLKNIYGFTNEMEYKLLVELTHFDGSTAYAMYDHFRVEGPDTNYTLRVHGYSGTAGDSLNTDDQNYKQMIANGMQFRTPDRLGCASTYRSGWWWNYQCTISNLNGEIGNASSVGTEYVNWFMWRRQVGGIKHVEMKIRPAFVRK